MLFNFRLFDFLKNKKELYKNPVINLELKLTGWEGPFNSESTFNRITERYNLIKKDYSGIFSLYKIDDNTAKLVSGIDKKLHIIKGSIDLYEYGGLNNLHIHLSTKGIFNLHPNLKGYLKTEISDKPRYTLNGLYDTLFTFTELFSKESNKKINPDEKKDRKIKALKEELLKHRNYIFDTIATRKETQLKLLENIYKRLISNQNNHGEDFVKALSA